MFQVGLCWGRTEKTYRKWSLLIWWLSHSVLSKKLLKNHRHDSTTRTLRHKWLFINFKHILLTFLATELTTFLTWIFSHTVFIHLTFYNNFDHLFYSLILPVYLVSYLAQAKHMWFSYVCNTKVQKIKIDKIIWNTLLMAPKILTDCKNLCYKFQIVENIHRRWSVFQHGLCYDWSWGEHT